MKSGVPLLSCLEARWQMILEDRISDCLKVQQLLKAGGEWEVCRFHWELPSPEEGQNWKDLSRVFAFC